MSGPGDDRREHGVAVGATPSMASARDTARVLGGVLTPMLAQGVIARRPRLTARAERHRLDDGAVTVLQEMRGRYGSGPLRLRIPGRSVALLRPTHGAPGSAAPNPPLHRSPP